MISSQILGMRMEYRETFFVNPPASCSSPYPGGFNSWISKVTEDTSPHATSERQIPDTALVHFYESLRIVSAVDTYFRSNMNLEANVAVDKERNNCSNLLA